MKVRPIEKYTGVEASRNSDSERKAGRALYTERSQSYKSDIKFFIRARSIEGADKLFSKLLRLC